MVQKQHSTKTCLVDAKNPRHAILFSFYYQGFEDSQSGQGFRSEYETWEERHQRNYERGRLQFAEYGQNAPLFQYVRRNAPHWISACTADLAEIGL